MDIFLTEAVLPLSPPEGNKADKMFQVQQELQFAPVALDSLLGYMYVALEDPHPPLVFYSSNCFFFQHVALTLAIVS